MILEKERGMEVGRRQEGENEGAGGRAERERERKKQRNDDLLLKEQSVPLTQAFIG